MLSIITDLFRADLFDLEYFVLLLQKLIPGVLSCSNFVKEYDFSFKIKK